MYRLSLCLALLVALGLSGCDSTAEEAGAQVRVLLTDAPFPFDLVAEANVAIERVELVGEDEERVVLADFTEEPARFNLLDLRNGVTAELAVQEVPGNEYEQIRLVLSEAIDTEIVLVDEDPDDGVPARTFAFKVPSGTQSGIKIPLPALDVDAADETVEVVVDFDVERSFVVQGNPKTAAGISGFLFKPVVKVKSLVLNGEDVALGEDEGDEEADAGADGEG